MMRAQYHIILTLSLFLSLFLVVNGFTFATKRTNKIVASVDIGGISYLREVTWDPEQFTQNSIWSTYNNASFPNGVFIESLEHPGLVWDIKGNNAVAGASVILSNVRNNLIDTKHQRWVKTSDNRYTSILNSQMAIMVNATGFLVLAQHSSSNSFQQFYNFEISSIEVKNNKLSEVHVSSVTPFGWGPIVVIPSYDITEWITYFVVSFTGSIITFKDNNGNVLPPSPVDFTGQSLYLTFDDYNPLPVGENLVFVGKIFDTISSNFTATLTSAGHLYGTGEDEFGDFIVGGHVSGYLLLDFFKEYDYDGFNLFNGGVSYNPFTVYGNLRTYDYLSAGSFSYVLVNVV